MGCRLNRIAWLLISGMFPSSILGQIQLFRKKGELWGELLSDEGSGKSGALFLLQMQEAVFQLMLHFLPPQTTRASLSPRVEGMSLLTKSGS